MRIVDRVKRFASEDEDMRKVDKRYREQRYAKLMQWAEPIHGPWEDSTNVTLPDIMTDCLRTEDTLCNAALATRPMITSRALNPDDTEKQRKIDLLHDNQFFVEQAGERLLERMAMNFVRDGVYTNYVRWVSEFRKIEQLRVYDPIPLGMLPEQYFQRILQNRFTPKDIRRVDDEGWDWEIVDLFDNELSIRFFTSATDEVEMEVRGEVKNFDGPLIQTMSYESVLHPYWCENLQMPSPSNPNGAEHVILIDRPTIDEVRRLVSSRYYDLVSIADIENRAGMTTTYEMDRPEHDLERQRDVIRGNTDLRTESQTDARNQDRTLRYVCFDLWAKDGTGESMDVVWTVLPDLDLLVRARPLGELMPGNPPRRPFGEGAFLPIQDRRIGMSQPELMEGLHDFQTKVFNAMGDACDMEMQPFGTYKPGGNINPEEYTIFPGAMLPRQNPDDLSFEKITPTAASIGINQITLAQQMQEKLTSIGDLQFGRIPTGKSAALRTAGGVGQLLQQGEARPERILRRFFLGLRDTFSLMWQLNREFLDDEKRFRTYGVSAPNEDPFIQLSKTDLSGDYQFDFGANVLNSSKAMLQEAFSNMTQLLLNPLAIQLGIARPENLYHLYIDQFRAWGQTPEKYVSEPVQGAHEPKFFAAEALSKILGGELPAGAPAEPMAQDHLTALAELLQRTDDEGVAIQQTMEPFHQQLLAAWTQKVQMKLQEQQQQAQMMANAQSLQSQLQQDGPPGQGAKPVAGQGPVAKNDVMDESMPSSGTPQG